MRQVRSHLSYQPRWAVSVGLLVVVLLALSLPAPASAGNISVTTTDDQLDGSAPCSLREAVNTANADADSGGCTDTVPIRRHDVITLAAGDYNLSLPGVEDFNASGDLDVTESLTIAGVGAGVSRIDGNGAITGDRVLHILSGTLTISGLTIHHGSQSSGFEGGGIRGEPEPGSTLGLTNSAVSDNTTTTAGGGGISADNVTLTDSSVSGNTAGGGGGGIVGAGSGNVTLTGSSVSGNTASLSGGGIVALHLTLTGSSVSGNTTVQGGGGVSGGTATLTDSSVSGNTATGAGGGISGFAPTLTDSTVRRNEAGAKGGGIYTGFGSASLTRSTVSDNESTTNGGGIFVETGTLSVTNSTLSGNQSTNNGGGIFFSSPGTLNVTNSTLSGNASRASGGALSTDEGTTNLRNVTVNRNVADADAAGSAGSGGGLHRFGTATVTIRNTILAGNLDRSAPVFRDWNCNGGVVSQGYNLFSSTAGCAVAPATGDQTAADPGLALLANNGGRTLTHALLSGSPAINTGNPAAPGSGGNACPFADQRGVPRSLGGRCDKGAYERVTCRGKLVNRVGTGGADLLIGTQAADGILALGGNDVLRGGSAGDGLCGGADNDQLFGEAGPDFLDGGGGTDTCNGGTESDQAAGCETISSVP